MVLNDTPFPLPIAAKSIITVLLAIMCIFTTNLHAACLDNLQAETPSADFTFSDVVVVHNTTGLMWMRCALGQKWSSEANVCTQDASTERLYTWPEALSIAHSIEVGGYADWRLPNKNELSSIVERACTGPAINEQIYPGTALASFWTSTPSLSVTAFAWRVDFTTGTMVPSEQTNRYNVRLVREP